MAQQSNNWKTASVILLAGVIVLSVVVGIYYFSTTIHSTGTVYTKTINCAAYFDIGGTQAVTAINWGQMTPDSAVNMTVYLKNTGNAPCNYTIAVSNWNPINANTWITLQYDFKGAVNVPVNAIIPVVLTESISPNITSITNYSYDITITASG